jgi:hypothetical protein
MWFPAKVVILMCDFIPNPNNQVKDVATFDIFNAIKPLRYILEISVIDSGLRKIVEAKNLLCEIANIVADK